jgi:hypothetical protein
VHTLKGLDASLGCGEVSSLAARIEAEASWKKDLPPPRKKCWLSSQASLAFVSSSDRCPATKQLPTLESDLLISS